MIKYLIWDFDGVLCNSKHEAFSAHNKICKKFQKLPHIYNETDYAEVFNCQYDMAIAKYLSKEEIEEYFETHRKIMISKKDSYNLYEKIFQCINHFKQKSIIITSTSAELVRYIIKNNGYNSNIFVEIIGRETEGSKSIKLIDLCSRYNLNKEKEIIYIGDTLNDVITCEKLNIPVIAISYGYSDKKAFTNKNVLTICECQEELIDFINNIKEKKDML